MFKIKVNTQQVESMFNDLEKMPKSVMKDAFRFYKNETPVRSGNARNKTKLRNKQIKSGYPYAGRLDEGWSKQAPKGMTEPTLDEIDNIIDKELRRIGR
tara:strand:+ start:7701 stop:7997 length:297 start_codon:yes stop_codon:yes gene_type:complete